MSNSPHCHTESMHERWTSAVGLDCVINPCTFSSGKYHLCGYIRVPPGHPLHGVEYNSPVPRTLDATVERIKQGTVGKRGIMDLFRLSLGGEFTAGDLLNVHGGITYSGSSAPGEPEADGEHWYGFDCGHSGDHPSSQNAAYVRAECEGLAQQIAEIGGLLPIATQTDEVQP